MRHTEIEDSFRTYKKITVVPPSANLGTCRMGPSEFLGGPLGCAPIGVFLSMGYLRVGFDEMVRQWKLGLHVLRNNWRTSMCQILHVPTIRYVLCRLQKESKLNVYE